jgi:amino acid adenylation domain-containing protein
MKKSDIQDVYPLSPLQEGLLYQSLADPGAYVVQMVFDVVGECDAARFVEAWQLLVDRHEAFRTAFFYESLSKPVQAILKQRTVPIQFETVTGDAAPAIADLAARERARGFDLQRDPLLRLTLIRTAGNQVLIWTYHHLVMDGWSLSVVQQELNALYDSLCLGVPAELPPPATFAPYQAWLRRQDGAAARAWWRAQLESVDRLTTIPEDATAASPDTGHDGEHRFVFDEHDTRALSALAATFNVTLAVVVQAIWSVLLRGYNDCDHAIFGAVVSGRPPDVPDIQRAVGLFINAVPIAVSVRDDESVGDLLARLHHHAAGAQTHAYLSLSEIADAANRTAVFDHLVVFDNYPEGAADQAPRLSFRTRAIHDRTHYALSLVVYPGRVLHVTILHDRRHHSEAQVRRIESHVRHIAAQLRERPDAPIGSIAVAPPSEDALLSKWSVGGPRVAAADGSVLDAFNARVDDHPDAIAVDGRETVTYRELRRLAVAVADALRVAGIGGGDRVALVVDRDARGIAAMLGVLACGAAYVPIDPSYPPARVTRLIGAGQCAAVIVADAHHRLVADATAPIVPLGAIRPGDDDRLRAAPRDALAYVLYTSGSTGEPKGCAIEHQQLWHYVRWARAEYDGGQRRAWPLFTSLAFDLTLTSIFVPLVSGGRVCVPDAADLNGTLGQIFAGTSGIDTVKLTPAHITLLADLSIERTTVTLAVVGGEALTLQQVATLRRLNPSMRIVNEYGPTEATVGCIVEDLDPAAMRVDIGKPIAGMRAYVLDRARRPAPIGIPGELYVAGDGVGRGYFNADALTRERFTADPFAGGRMYRTGDRARWRDGGTLDYLGRADGQLKVRGFRLEPGEVETAIEALAGVRKAVVEGRVRAGGVTDLIAFVEAAGEEVSAHALRAALAARVPTHMVPTEIVVMAALPLTINGKVDRALLSRHDTRSSAGQAGWATDTERDTAALWSEVLGTTAIGADEDFFSVGGHSLKALQLVARVQKTTGARIALNEFIGAPTVRSLAKMIDRRRGSVTGPASRIPVAARQGSYALSHAQQRLWMLHQMGAQTAYNMPRAFLLTGDLNVAALERALQGVVDRHEILRTSFQLDRGEPRQVVQDAARLPLNRVDLSAEADPTEAARRFAERDGATPFDLEVAPLVRAHLLQTGPRQRVLVLTLHHIIADGWSMNILHRELIALYEDGSAKALAALPVQYRDYSEWQAARDYRLDERYWLEALQDAPPLLRWPGASPTEEARDFRGDIERLAIDSAVAAGLRDLARRRGTTMSTVVLTLFSVLLNKVTRQQDFLIGVSSANRAHADLEPLIGFFVNVLPIHVSVAPDMDFDGLLGSLITRTLAAYEHQHYPFDLLIKQVNPDRVANRQPLLNVVYGFQNYADIKAAGGPAAGTGSDAVLHDARELPIGFCTSKFDLTLFVTDRDQDLLLELEYDTALVTAAAIRQWLKNLAWIAGQIIEEEQRSEARGLSTT